MSILEAFYASAVVGDEIVSPIERIPRESWILLAAVVAAAVIATVCICAFRRRKLRKNAAEETKRLYDDKE